MRLTVHARARRGRVTAAENDAVAWAATARRWLVCCGVGGEGTKALGEVRRARRSEAGLTQIATHRWGSGAARRGVVAVDGGEAGSVATDDGALALHHAER
jgi:hypothetical protein